MSAFVVILILWLDPDGSIVAHASGVAVNEQVCTALAQKNIESERAQNPELKDKKPVVLCLNTRKYARPSAGEQPAPEHKPLPPEDDKNGGVSDL